MAAPSCIEARGPGYANVHPQYPSRSQRHEEEGTTRLQVRVDALGYPRTLEIRASSGFEKLDQAALNAVRTWCFVPAMSKGDPVEQWVVVPIRFQMEDGDSTSATADKSTAPVTPIPAAGTDRDR